MRSRNVNNPAASPAATSSSADPTLYASPEAPAAASSSSAAAPLCHGTTAIGREGAGGCSLFFWRQQQHPGISYGHLLQSILLHAENRPVLRQFLLFAVLLAVVPLSVLLLLPHLLLYLWSIPTEAAAATAAAAGGEGGAEDVLRSRAAAAARDWAAIAAVICVNIIALCYAYRAYGEELADWRLISQQQQQRRAAAAGEAAAGRGGQQVPAPAAAATKQQEREAAQAIEKEAEEKKEK